MSCNRCSQSSSTPANFLLLCKSCNKHWHHRCHPPPLENDELVQLIRCQTAGDRDNGLDVQSLRPRPDDNQQPPPSVQAQASGLHFRRTRRKSIQTLQLVVVDQRDPASREPPIYSITPNAHNTTTTAASTNNSRAIIQVVR
ncbi:hypothetical protein BDR07DRAFT_1068090 [Suillus spraguei]|nr:hypothetical protein BDR07DRAFT_1068090 [Suillus spraguei]